MDPATTMRGSAANRRSLLQNFYLKSPSLHIKQDPQLPIILCHLDRLMSAREPRFVLSAFKGKRCPYAWPRGDDVALTCTIWRCQGRSTRNPPWPAVGWYITVAVVCASEMCFATSADGTRSSASDRMTSACGGMSSGHSISSCHRNLRQNVCMRASTFVKRSES